MGRGLRRVARCLAAGVVTGNLSVQADLCFPAGIPQVQLVPLADVLRCLQNLTISANAVYYTLLSVQHGVDDAYSFRDIARNSSVGTQSTVAGCKLDVHNVQVNLPQALENLKTELMRRFSGVTEFEQLRTLPADKETNAYDFHERLADIFRRLADANTWYRPPWYVAFKSFHYRTSEGTQLGLKVMPQPTGGPVVMIKLDQLATEDKDPWKQASELDGKEAWQWLLDEAGRMGRYKSKGVRLNDYLSSWANGGFWVRTHPFPEKPELNISYSNGSVLIARVDVSSQKSIVGTDGFRQELNVNKDWATLQPWLNGTLVLMPTQRSVVELELKGPTANRVEAVAREPALAGSRARPAAPQDLESGRRLADTAVLVDKWPQKLQDGTEFPPMFVGYWLEQQKVAVLKVPSFAPLADMPFYSRMPELSYSRMYAGLFNLYTKLVEKSGSSDRLILDLSDNDGGDLQLANLLVQLLAPRHENRTQLCNEYSVRWTAFWEDWLDSYGGKWDDVKTRIEQMSEADLDHLFTRLVDLEGLADSLVRSLPIRQLALEALKFDYSISRTVEEKRAHFVARITRRDFVFNSDFGNRLFASGSEDGWFPFTGAVFDPKTGKFFDPKIQPFRQPVDRDWGGQSAKYAGRYLHSCDPPFMMSKWGKYKHQWKELAILTNGLCGGACSLVASKLQFAEGATVFSLGGIPGEMMDSSSYAGGDVLSWGNFWSDVLFAGIIGDMLYGSQTAMAQRLRAETAKPRLYGDTFLLPLPTRAQVSYNFHMMFLKELGADALPREWYNLPAHRHYDKWVFTDQYLEGTWVDLFPIYATISGEDWQALRKAGAFNGKKPDMYGCAAAPPTEAWVNPEKDDDDDGDPGWKPDDGPVTPPQQGISTGMQVFMWILFALLPCALGTLLVLVVFRKAQKAEVELAEAQQRLEQAVEQRNAREVGRPAPGGPQLEMTSREQQAI